jgi:cytochrome c peroxidase
MKKRFDLPAMAILLGLLTVTGPLLAGSVAWGAPGQAIPPPTLLPLNQIPVPEPPNLFQFVKNKPAAIKLGKALFWDMQAGSDGVQACASCHFSAGADNRVKNTVNPGSRAGDNFFQVRGPNETLQSTDFPFHQRQAPVDFQASPVVRDINDVVGSQGVKFTSFLAINAGSAVDSGTPIPDLVFQAGGVNMRRVTARNTPTNINAVFNFTNFWDGRAHFIFNGANPFGPLDPNAGVLFNVNNALVKQKIAIEFASLASQATGPPLDDTEMSFGGRTFPQLGRKLLSLTPLGKQIVHPNDSVLGPLSKAVLLPNGKISGNKGINAAYSDMIKAAFQDNLTSTTLTTPDGFTQMEANFSLFWGLAIQLYEATLVSDQTPFDRFLGGDRAALTPQQQDGFNLFFGAGACSACHAGTELSNASVRASAFVTNAANALIEQMPVANAAIGNIIYDSGFNNTAVRPTTEDIGRGGNSPFTNPQTLLPLPLSFSRLAELQALGNLPFATPILPIQLPATFPVANDGNFKIPGLRNVELTAPYFHNGGVMTLDDVVEFYTRGGNFPAANANSLDIAIVQIGALQNNPTGQAALVAFMMSMTDERVRNQSAPFDHPELFIPNGDPNVADPDVLTNIPARDANGVAAVVSTFAINPVTTPTNLPSQLISGTKEAGTTIQVTVNGQPVTPVTVTDTTWSVTVGGLVEGANSISVIATDLAGIATTLPVTITVDTVPPALTIDAIATPAKATTQTISGTVETGITPKVTVSSSAAVGPVTVSGASWSAQLTGLRSGANNITVTATDPAGNVTSAVVAIIVPADGIFNGTTIPDISDAIRALRIAVGLIPATPDDLLHGDVAPLGAPDGKIDIVDVVMIMRNIVGSVSL